MARASSMETTQSSQFTKFSSSNRSQASTNVMKLLVWVDVEEEVLVIEQMLSISLVLSLLVLSILPGVSKTCGNSDYCGYAFKKKCNQPTPSR